MVTLFAYDYDNRLIKITYADGSVIQFGYDGLGRRVWRQDNHGTRFFFYDGDRIIAEWEGNSWVVRHLLALQPCGFVANGAVRIYHADRLGSVRWVTDASQSIIASYVYEGFGKVIAQNGGGGGPYQFCGLWGYRNDHDVGLIHVGARYYEPETGRFGQKDPLIALNFYAYVDNNPINFTDSTGLTKDIDLGSGWRVHPDPKHPPKGHVDVIPPRGPKIRIYPGWKYVGKIPKWVLEKLAEKSQVVRIIGPRIPVIFPFIPVIGEILDSIINDKHPTLFGIPLPYRCKNLCPYCWV